MCVCVSVNEIGFCAFHLLLVVVVFFLFSHFWFSTVMCGKHYSLNSCLFVVLKSTVNTIGINWKLMRMEIIDIESRGYGFEYAISSSSN